MPVMFDQLEETISVAGHEHGVVVIRKLQHRRVGGVFGQDMTQQRDVVAQFAKEIAQVVRYVLIEQELHGWS